MTRYRFTGDTPKIFAGHPVSPGDQFDSEEDLTSGELELVESTALEPTKEEN